MRLGLLGALVLAVAGCGTQHGGGLLLTLDSADALTVTTVTLDIVAATRTKQIIVPVAKGTLPPAIEVGIEFPPDVLGTVSVTATGGGKAASGTAIVVAEQTAALKLKFPREGADLLVSTPTEIEFGEVATSSKSPAVLLTVTNTGTTDSAILAVSTTDPVFSVSDDTCDGKSLPMGQSCTLRVEFAPVATGVKTAFVDVGDLSVAVSGTGVTPGALVSADSPFDFGPISVTETATKTFTVRNAGSVASGSITVDPIAGTDPNQFSIKNDSCNGGALEPADTCAIEIEYHPAAIGAHTASLKVSSLKAGKLTLSWTGEARAATLAIVPTEHDFGAITAGTQSADFLMIVTNNAAIAIGPITVTSAPPFAVQGTSTCAGATIAPDATCTVVMRFAPTTGGVFTAGAVVLSAPNLPTDAQAALRGVAFTCVDADGDGFFIDSSEGEAGAARCGTANDCSDSDTDNWDKCATCADADGDGFYTGCNRYMMHYSECDATAGDPLAFPDAEAIGDTDLDCDGRTMIVDDNHGIFVATGGLGSNPGTAAAPVQTLSQALAKIGPSRKAIFVQAGGYPEPLSPPVTAKNVSIMGGFDTSWNRNVSTNAVYVQPATDVGATLASASTMRLDGIRLEPVAFDAAVFSMGAHVKLRDAYLKCGTGKSTLIAKDLHTIVQADTVQMSCGSQTVTSIATRVSNSAMLTMVNSSVTSGTTQSGTTSTSIEVNGATLSLTGTTLSASSPSNRKNLTILGTTPVVGIKGGSLSTSGPIATICWGIVQSAGTVTVENASLTTCSSSSSRAVNATGGESLVFLNNSINGTGQPSNNGAISVDGVTKVIIANNYIKQTGGTGITGVLIGNLPASNVFELVNNIIEVGVQSYGVIVNGTGGTINLRNNSITGGDCALYSGACAASVNSCTGVSRCGVLSGNITTVCDRDVDGVHLTSTSACKSAGTDPTLSSTGTVVLSSSFSDVDGTLRPSGVWDIGTDEVAN